MTRSRICMRAECRENRGVRESLARAEGRIDALEFALGTVSKVASSAADEARALRRRVSVLEAALGLSVRLLSGEERAAVESMALVCCCDGSGIISADCPIHDPAADNVNGARS